LGLFGPLGASRSHPAGGVLHQPLAPGPRGAPPRGVDVKPPRGPGSRRVPGPWGPLEGARRASWRSRRASWPARPRERSRDPVPEPARGGVLHQPLAPGPRGSPGRSGGPSGAQEAEIPQKGDFGPKSPKKGLFGPTPGKPRKSAFSGSRGATGGSPRGVDVKPPSRGVLGVWKKAQKGPFSEKRPKIAILGKKAHFRAFWGFSAPSGPPGATPREGFYINPSRRGPAVPGGGWLLAPRCAGAGVARRASGALPRGAA